MGNLRAISRAKAVNNHQEIIQVAKNSRDLSEFVSLQFTLPISFVIENLELDQCILPVLKSNVIVLLKFKNDDYDTKNPTRWADTDSRDNNIYVL